MKKTRPVGLGLLLAFAFGIAACGSDDTTETAAGPADSAAVQAAEAAIAPLLKTPTSIGIDEPLASKPESGRTVAWLEGNIATTQAVTPGFEAAAKSVGWNLEVISYDVNDPQATNTALQQAVDRKVDYIVSSATPTVTIKTGLAAARAAGIPFVQLTTDPEPDAEGKGVLACVFCNTNGPAGEILANYLIAKSGGKSKAVYFNVPELTVLKPLPVALKKGFDACDGCSVEVQDSSIQSVTKGELPSQVVAYLQSNPDTTDVVVAAGAFAIGVRQAMKTAGIGDDVRIVSQAPEKANVEALISVDENAYVTVPLGEFGWRSFDVMLRHDQDADLAPSLSPPVLGLWDTGNVPKPAKQYFGAEGYEDQFRTLWKVG